ncbi:hypothetical protein [Paenibacillus alginolyticus]|uniref:hypothetical protein n=1 Tax=Paenibacillus alginolyticus TaxID=59839 RepID=UPI0008E14AC6|nr:hypothetical protein [Paenibacillus alginolyticus]MEC0148693.1 hypothetical protein [Paenibacillus alginolyticus]SFM40446.1 hypothetical protein SAMN03159341_13123 [Paenibacillus sp. 1_12]
MGHGWKVIGRSQVSKQPCKCEQGFIIDYEIEQESDWSATNRISYDTEVQCPNKNCPSK